ncbi:uncharacterized protein LOC113316668 [Papaver somniferum]|uniref:uncharacterized protein LOC113316668 n=1 Tax=Papaver somniferum TaxID=3469 RepID=UPI000E704E6F|nr:uncharacterized protein LOC113316668 [Papaver somniferum]
MDMNPLRHIFIVDIKGLTWMSDATWKTKVDVFKRWGWSEEHIQTAFRKHPYYMMHSEKKITAVMDFLVNEMGYDSLSIAENPKIFHSSLKKRIIPRCSIIIILVSKGLIKKKNPLTSLSGMTDESFSEKFVKLYEREAPEVMKVFQGQLNYEDLFLK